MPPPDLPVEDLGWGATCVPAILFSKLGRGTVATVACLLLGPVAGAGRGPVPLVFSSQPGVGPEPGCPRCWAAGLGSLGRRAGEPQRQACTELLLCVGLHISPQSSSRHQPHFTDGKTEAQRSKGAGQLEPLPDGRAGICA